MLTQDEVTAEYDAVISRLLKELNHTAPDSKEYADIVDKVLKMDKLRDTNRRRRPSPDTVINAVASLGGIVLILLHERRGIITSKALGFVSRPK